MRFFYTRSYLITLASGSSLKNKRSQKKAALCGVSRLRAESNWQQTESFICKNKNYI